MPHLIARIPGPASEERGRRVAAFLADLTVAALKKKREVTSVAVECQEPAQWFVGGRSLAEHGLAAFFLEIKVTEGTNTKDEKADFVAKAFAGMETILGPLLPACYVVIQELPADAWGFAGATQEYRYIKGKGI